VFLAIAALTNLFIAGSLAALAWLIGRKLRAPQLVHALWLVVLFKLLTPPFISVPDSWVPTANRDSACRCETCQRHGPTSTAVTILNWTVPGVWLAGTLGTMATVIRRRRHFGRLLALAAPAPAAWQRQAAILARRLGIRRAPIVWSVPGRVPPMVLAGWRASKVVVPAELAGSIAPRQRKALLLHELAHVRRGDHLVRLAELAVRIAYWWLPPVGMICRHLRAAEEECCDAIVASQLPQSRRQYAQLLVDVVEFLGRPSSFAVKHATTMTAFDSLHDRVVKVLAAPRRRPAKRGRQARPRRWSGCVAALALVPWLALPVISGRQETIRAEDRVSESPELTDDPRTWHAAPAAPSAPDLLTENVFIREAEPTGSADVVGPEFCCPE
jgi:beta-lactamase regulating signal transducer with metallopeptidase domain